MATHSVLKHINLSKKNIIHSFVSALENAQNKSSKKVEYTRTVSDVSGDALKKIFEDNKWPDISKQTYKIC